MRIGQHLQKLRIERRVTLAQAAGTDCSPSTLSRFENGRSQLPAEVFINIITRLHLDWAEFRPTPGTQQSALIGQYHQAVTSRSAYQLLTLREALQDNQHRPLLYRTEYYIVELTLARDFPETLTASPQLIQTALDYLVKIDYWNDAAFTLASLLTPHVPITVLDNLARHAIYQSRDGQPSAEEVDRTTILLTDIALKKARRGDFHGAETTLTSCQLPAIPPLFTAMRHKFVAAFIRWRQGDEAGREQVQALLKLLETLDAGDVAARWRQEIKSPTGDRH
ncbi:helix-turn-helix domain-containing protein [Schleiferilactobacillus harbinensis]|uniref:helix-turn-helix domain-containing protein n=1 Tax=Schleiferilactobacillus harbinensis TaxID=304207 RepID=UPI001238A5CF|nr:helix-turn-helix transcriptional regulator [Schleiferilactobacillus harbinensis]QEU48700.1 helix-turn-helix transcriptional regulator [Schleiferilactobacillus harbinensis]